MKKNQQSDQDFLRELEGLRQRVAEARLQLQDYQDPPSLIERLAELEGKEEDYRTLLETVRNFLWDAETWRQPLNQGLRVGTERLRLILEAASDGFWDLDFSNDLMYYSPSWARMLGYETEELNQKGLRNWMAWSHPDDQELLRQKLRSHLNSESAIFECEHRLRHRDGRWKWVLARGKVAIWDSRGEPLRLMGTHTDITRRKQTEEALRASEHRLNLAVEASEAAIYDYNLDSDELFYSPRIFQIIGCPGRETLDSGKRFLAWWLQQVHPDDRRRVETAFDALLAGIEERCQLDYRVCRHNGEWSYVQGWSRIIQCGPEGRARRVLGVITDITERKQTENSLRQAQNRLEYLLSTNPAVVYSCELHGGDMIITFVSHNLYQQLGYHPEEFIRPGNNRQDYWNTRLHPEDWPLVESGFSELLETGFRVVEYRYRHKNGSYRWLYDEAKLIERDGYQEIIGSWVDITMRKEAEAVLAEFNRTLELRVERETRERMAKEQLLVQQAKMAAIGEMLGAIAHQWKQPLQVLRMTAAGLENYARQDQLDVDKLMIGVDRLRGNVDFLEKTMQSFRNLMNPNQQRQDFLLMATIRELVDLFGAHYYATDNIRISLSGDEKLSARGYPNEFKQVILNLLNNARDAIRWRYREQRLPEEGRITISVRLENEYKQVEVSDNGGGIDPHVLPRVFEPYQTTRAEQGGMGIGLYISKTIVEQRMSGQLFAKNNRDGAVFILWLK